jgi:hypothetical protein
MAIGHVAVSRINRMLDGSNEENQELARAAVENASSVREVAETVNLFDDMSEELAAEGRAVFDGLPPEVHREILDALRSGLDRRVAITVEWEERADIGVQISHHPTSGAVHIVLECPDGQEFLRS